MRVASGQVAPRVDAEEGAFRYVCGDNGADALWCRGSTTIGRIGDKVFLSALERLEAFKPLNNARSLLLGRGESGWELQQAEEGRTREPCPMAVFPDGRLFLYVNPTRAAGEQPGGYRDGPADPHLLEFAAADPGAAATRLTPLWDAPVTFQGHSYRNLAADPVNGELFLTNQVNYTEMHWSFYDRDGEFSACGEVAYPWCDSYEAPGPDRICYHTIALQDRGVYVLGANDIAEPVAAWRDHKRALTNLEWDYVFRKLFFAWTPDVTGEPFAAWRKLADLDATGGCVLNMDLHVGPDGRVHLLWIQQTTDPRIRDRFLPRVKNAFTMEHCILHDGEVAARDILLAGGEGAGEDVPVCACLQPTPDGRLLVFCYVESPAGGQETDDAGPLMPGPRQVYGPARGRNLVMEVFRDGRHSDAVPVPLEHPMRHFLAATPRAGSPCSDTIDLIGLRRTSPVPAGGRDVCEQSYGYARVKLV